MNKILRGQTTLKRKNPRNWKNAPWLRHGILARSLDWLCFCRLHHPRPHQPLALHAHAPDGKKFGVYESGTPS